MNSIHDARREPRLEIESIVLPFLGSREDDFSPFQYLLADLSLHGAKIMIPRWLSMRERLSVGDTIDFHAPFRFAGETFSSGEIVWSRWEDELETQSCGVHFERRTLPAYPVLISLEEQSVRIDFSEFETSENLLQKVLKDAILLKRGVLVYLKHLTPYLSRISGLTSNDYSYLRSFLLEDGIRHVENNKQRLEQFFVSVQGDEGVRTAIQHTFDPEELLDAFEPELPADVFGASFTDESVAPYIRSIKLLEKKQYTIYNTIILLHISSFGTLSTTF